MNNDETVSQCDLPFGWLPDELILAVLAAVEDARSLLS
jgi:hypothetical protein